MANDCLIKIFLDDEKMRRLKEAGLDDHITEVEGRKVIEVTLPQKNQRKFGKAFPKAVLDDQTGEVDDFPEDTANLLFDVVVESKTVEVTDLFLMKAFKPLAGKELRRAVH